MSNVRAYLVKELAKAIRNTGSNKKSVLICHLIRNNPEWGAFEIADVLTLLPKKGV